MYGLIQKPVYGWKKQRQYCPIIQQVSTNTDTGGADTSIQVNDESKGPDCPSAAEFDKMVDYKSEYPFKNLKMPSSSRWKTYWKRGDITAKVSGGLLLTFSQFLQYLQSNKPLVRINNYSIPAGSGCSEPRRGNGCKNWGNVSLSKYTRAFGATGGRQMSDNQSNNSVMPSISAGLSAYFCYALSYLHGKNLCQMDDGIRGFVKYDCDCTRKAPCDGIGTKAMRIASVSKKARKFGIKPEDRLDLYHVPTLYAFCHMMGIRENGFVAQKGFMDTAFNNAKAKMSSLGINTSKLHYN